MKEDIINIINLERITRVRSSISVANSLPGKKSIVKLIPIEYLEQGVKVLIEGKLFIAFIESKIPIKEEIIAQVKSTNPFALSLNLSDEVSNPDDFLIDQIIKKFELKNKIAVRNTLLKVVQNGNILIKSKIKELLKLTNLIKSDGLEFSLLIDLVWNNSTKGRKFIEELYDTLFDESFEEVCKSFFDSINELLFSPLPQYLIQNIREKLIYDENGNSSKSINNKSESVLEIIKLLNKENSHLNYKMGSAANNFIQFGTKYILQKSILKDYEYYPDFIIVKRENSLTVVHYSIKKIIQLNKKASYKIIFKNEDLPFEISGIIRDNFLMGNIETNEELLVDDSLSILEENLFSNWGFRSAMTVNNKNFHISKINSEVNKLVS